MSVKKITHNDLVAWFAAGCKPREKWLIGTEHEKIGFDKKTLQALPYDGEHGIRRVLELFIKAQPEWQPVYEADNIIALKHGVASITLEPGGQLELSGAPLSSIHATYNETNKHLLVLADITQQLDIGFLTLSFHPKAKRNSIYWMPKKRYEIMRSYMPKVGKLGLDMMLRTATVQANLDFSNEADMACKMRVSICLQPLVTAMFAASPFSDGKTSPYLSQRARCWQDTDANRTGIPVCIFADDFSFAAYTEWLLDVPMYFVMRSGEYIDCSGQSFRDFMLGRLPALLGEYPTIDDWELHASTAFPEVRLKQFLEMRGADTGDSKWINALPALWKGLLYDADILAACRSWVNDWSYAEVELLRVQVALDGMQTKFRDGTVADVCATMLDYAETGLKNLNVCNDAGQNEAIYLQVLHTCLETGHTQANQWLNAYENDWHGNIDAVFSECLH
ncbi:MAG: glutamate--cysteine ligase [Mariprofundales bacterium]